MINKNATKSQLLAYIVQQDKLIANQDKRMSDLKEQSLSVRNLLIDTISDMHRTAINVCSARAGLGR